VLNQNAFVAPSGSSQGVLRRNVFRAPALRQIDLALSRSIPLPGRAVVRFRVDAFNVLNIANFGAPRHTFPDSQFGRPYQSYADALGTGSLRYGGLTPLQQVGGPRSIQIGLRFDF
jgi:hypothetical protein